MLHAMRALLLWAQVVLAGSRGADVTFEGDVRGRFVAQDDVLAIVE